ncbi:MAG: tetratricopeptide repeat protein [Ignavibacteriales bacterium]|nr:tetratricopeptide repeat protein [Ignavibacteriales bacterium]
MKPKVFCSECETELQWGDKFCASCGQPVEWTKEPSVQGAQSESFAKGVIACKMCGADNEAGAEFCRACGANLGVQHQKSPQKKKSKEQHRKSGGKNISDSPIAGSWKTIVGVIVFVVAGVLILEFATNRKDLPQVQQTEPVAGANMQAVSQIEEMEKQVAATPNDAQAIVKLANFLQDNRFYDKALKYYKSYLEKNPKDTNARVDFGICYFDLGKLDEAQQQMELALKTDPKHPMAHFNLGIVNLRAGKIKEANEWFKRTVALDPNSNVGQQAQQFLDQHSNSQNLQTK